MRLTPRLHMLLAFSCFLAGCAHQVGKVMIAEPVCSGSSARLNQAWRDLHQALETPGGCDQDGGRHCAALRAEISKLALDCPNSPEVLMANALLAFQAHDLARAQQLLDQLLSFHVAYPEAGSLRARIALEEGNLRFAIRFLEEQIRQFGDDFGLHETYASALFLGRRWDDARTQLTIASNLGAPAWRVAYGLGLIEETQGHYAQAKARYEEARQARPDWKQPDARLRALLASGKISQ